MTARPHGGRLVDRLLPAPEAERRRSELAELPKLQPFVDQVYDAEKIGLGAFSPLEGFMGANEFESVLATGRLPGGLAWPIPLILPDTGAANAATAASLRPGDDVALLDGRGDFFALLHLEEKFTYDKDRLARVAYGTDDPAHPNVADIRAAGPTALAGKVDLVHRLALPTGEREWTPAEARERFVQRGWKSVVAYQCRNPPHTAHEYLQRLSLERSEVDGLFIHPVVGRLKKGDYRPSVILDSYEALVRHYYSERRVALAALSITMRYAGPKAALLLAIVRQNFGCDYYIVGRDQAGVGKYYDPYACHRIFDEFPLEIVPLRYEETFFCRTCGWMATLKTCSHPAEQRLDTSQTRIRAALSKGDPLPSEIIRPEVAAILSRGDVLNTD